MIIKPKVRGFICVTAHPLGCAANVDQQIAYVQKQGKIAGGPKKVLVVGASTGYGLSSRIAAAYGSDAATLGVYFEREPDAGKPATAGWYNSKAFERRAAGDGLYAKSVNGDAFSDSIKRDVIEIIKKDLGEIDLLVYSLASPRRTHPKTGVVYDSVLKPVGQPFSSKTLNTDKETVAEISIEPANTEDIANTVAVMGGEDWEMWIDALSQAGVLSKGFKTVAYSYEGPEVTWSIYKDGTIGLAKRDLKRAAKEISGKLAHIGGQALVSVNKAVVTQASSAIPVVPLYISLLFKLMKEKGTHEDCIEQMYRMYASQLYSSKMQLDAEGQIRMDDWEMAQDIQKAVKETWPKVTTENVHQLSDFKRYKHDFLNLFGFEVPGIDYDADVDPVKALDGAYARV